MISVLEALERPRVVALIGAGFALPHGVMTYLHAAAEQWGRCGFTAVATMLIASAWIYLYRQAKQRIVDRCVARLTQGIRRCEDPTCCHSLECCPDCPEPRP